MKKIPFTGVVAILLSCWIIASLLVVSIAVRTARTPQTAFASQRLTTVTTEIKSSVASDDPVPQLLRLQVGTFDPLTDSPPQREVQNQQSQGADPNGNDPVDPFIIEPETEYHLIQFVANENNAGGISVDAIQLEQIAALGAKPLGYVPDNAYLVRVLPADAQKIAALSFVRWIGPYEPGYKLANSLAEKLAAPNPPSEIEVYIAGFEEESLSELETFILGQSGTIRSAVEASFGPIIAATISTTALDAILRNPAVSWVEPDIPLTLTNSSARSLMQTDQVWNDLGYYGAGQIVSIVDSGLSVQGALNADFSGRLRRAYSPAELAPSYEPCQRKTTWTDLNGHGTHVAGSAVGNGANSGSDRSRKSYASSQAGTAPEAELVFMAMGLDGTATLYCILLDGNFLSNGYDQGARIGSNSWGGTDRGTYGSLSRVVDEFVWNHPDYLALFAVGNSGAGARTVSSPATAKNVLSIGASENDRPTWGAQGDDPKSVAGFSSRGPTSDGRLKPDLVAPGTWILSTRAANAPSSSFWAMGNQNYAYHGGTSMATPLAAGGAALVREWLQRAGGIANPSAALLKATLIHGATSFNSAPNLNALAPDFSSGWGRINLNDTISARYLLLEDSANKLNTGQVATFTVEVMGVDQIGTFVAAPPSGYVNSLATTGVLTHTGTLTNTQHSTETIGAFFVLEPAEISSSQPTTPTISAASFTQIAESMIVDLTTPASQRSADPALESGTTTFDQSLIARLPTPDNPGPDNFESGTSEQNVAEPNAASFEPRLPAMQRADAQIRSAALTPDFLQNLISGGDFEDPEWTNEWQNVWLNSGDPTRTQASDEVISGAHSMRIGGTAIGNGIWYPINFPAEISSGSQATLSLNLRVMQQDNFSTDIPYDWFCITMVDLTGAFIEPFSAQNPDCWHSNGDYTVTKLFPNLEPLANFSGHLILYASSNGQSPHMSATIDDVTLTMQFADATLASTPQKGEAGTTFVLTGENFQPNSTAKICYQRCDDRNNPSNQIAQIAVDSSGGIAFSLQSNSTFAPATYTVQVKDTNGTTANTTFTIISTAAPQIALDPAEAVAGSTILLRGTGFENNGTTTVYLNGAQLGSAASSSDGRIALNLKTSPSTQAGIYQVRVVDNSGSVAEANLTILAPSRQRPTLTVSPPSGPAGTQFVFRGGGFDAGTAATLYFDNTVAGTVTTDAVGAFQFTLNSQRDAVVGLHTLRAQQPAVDAEINFDITAEQNQPTERVTELSFTLGWTDPPAQQFAASALINNLDLTVDGPSGRIYGYGGDQFGSAGVQPDLINNVERVRLVDPQPGTYVITVRAARVDTVYGAQPFALIGTQEQVSLAENAAADPPLDTPLDTPVPINTATPVATTPPDVTATPISDVFGNSEENESGEENTDEETGEDTGEDNDGETVSEGIEQNSVEAPPSTPAATSPGTATFPAPSEFIFMPLVSQDN